MTKRNSERGTGTTAFAVAVAAVLMVSITTSSAAQTSDGVWTVTCGVPVQNNPFLDLLPTGGYNGPWRGPANGHLEVKTLNRAHPEGSISTEMWVLSERVGWWRLKAVRVHPEDLAKISLNQAENVERGIRQIIDAPFLKEPIVIETGQPGGEEVVTGQILALMPDAEHLRCAPKTEDSATNRVATAQRALARRGHDPGPIDGLMGARTEAALRAFQTEQGWDAHGQLDGVTFDRLITP